VAYLEGKGFELDKHDLKKDPPSRELLEQLIDEEHLEDFVNTRSPAYKERNLDVRTMTKKQAIDLMMEDPNLMRRPLVVDHGKGKGKAVFGYKPEDYDRLGGR